MSVLDPKNALQVIRGTSKTLLLTVADSSTAKPVNLTGARVIFTVKRRLEDQNPVIQKTSDYSTQVLLTTPTAGQAEIYLTPSDTQTLEVKDYVFDIWVVLASGKRYAVVPPSVFSLKAGVTVLT